MASNNDVSIILSDICSAWKSCVPCIDHSARFAFAVKHVVLNGLWLELGVASGGTIGYIAAEAKKHAKIVYGCDSFLGLPEDWDRVGRKSQHNKRWPKGHFSRKGEPPNKPDNVEWVIGWFNESLPQFLVQHPNEPIAFLHVDCDIYSSTKHAFDALNECIVPGTVIVFDELHEGGDGTYPEWDQHEAKAFAEFVVENDVGYEWIAMFDDGRAIVKVT